MAYVAFTKVAYKKQVIPLSVTFGKGVAKGDEIPFEMFSFEGRDCVSAVEGIYEILNRLFIAGKPFSFEDSNLSDGIDGYIHIVNKENEKDRRKIPVFLPKKETESAESEIKTELVNSSSFVEELLAAAHSGK